MRFLPSELRPLALSVGALVVLAIGVGAQSNAPAERFRAFAVNLDSTVAPTGGQTVEIVVDRWSTEAERNRLLSVLLEQGPAKLLDALQDVPRLGYITGRPIRSDTSCTSRGKRPVTRAVSTS